MEHNILAYWRSLQNLPAGHEDRPSPRVCRLLTDVLERWQTKLPFLEQGALGHLLDHYYEDEKGSIKNQPVAKRKALSVVKTLEIISQPDTARKARTFGVSPDDLVAGIMPPYSVGQGKELMLYLNEDEALSGQLKYINEWSPFGHVVPNYQRLVETGLLATVQSVQEKMKALDVNKPDDKESIAFYDAVIIGLKGVIEFAERYAKEAERVAGIHKDDPERHGSLKEMASRLRRIPAHPARNFLEAVQCIHIMHCALHWTGEIVSLGRLDQILYPFYQQDINDKLIDDQQAQEIIDCWWLKLDDQVMLKNEFFEDRFSSSDGALLGAGGASNFDQGALGNQWMQQCTLGGVKATNDESPEDASNPVTYLCLNASRRMPLNSPTLDLRVHKNTPRELLEAAAKTHLSGGAHPVMLNDDKLIPELHEKTGGYVELASARNYCCDGCYETIFPGETEFSFGYIPGMDVLEKALNGGAGFGAAGGTYLRGMKTGFRTPEAKHITDFEEFWSILNTHIETKTHEFIAGILGAYGIKAPYCPSILLSPLIDGCLESGRDFSAGGARYHMFAPLMTGISTVSDSLYVIKKYVFEEQRFTLEELVSCLRSNWGLNPDVIGLKLPDERIREIHQQCLGGAKFGTGDSEVDGLAYRLIETFTEAVQTVKNHPIHQDGWDSLRNSYGTDDKPFEILFTPGVGTFEQYVFGGSFAGASADGRMAGDAIASDLSVSPVPGFLDASFVDENGQVRHSREIPIDNILNSYNHPSINSLSDGAACDINIREDVTVESLTNILERFAKGEGSNIMTVTVANPETFAAADKTPDNFELLRVRMGGWTEFYSVLFSAHRAQQSRRPQIVID